jgi:hypothetical protein
MLRPACKFRRAVADATSTAVIRWTKVTIRRGVGYGGSRLRQGGHVHLGKELSPYVQIVWNWFLLVCSSNDG